MHGPSSPAPKIDKKKLSIFAVEVLARLNETIEAIEKAYRDYEFNTVAQRLYDFIWSDYCDWFVEAAKTDIFSEDESKKKSALAVMDYVLSAIVRLLHPFMPHITEELWSLLGLGKESIQFAPPPVRAGLAVKAELAKKRRLVAAIYETVQAGRNLRSQARIPSNKKERFILVTANAGVSMEKETISRLLNAGQLDIGTHERDMPGTPIAATPLGHILLIVDVDHAGERERLEKEIAKIESELKTVNKKLKNKSFVDRAPRQVVELHRQRQRNFTEQLAKLKQARERLG